MQIYHHTEGRFSETALVYSAAAYLGWGDLVYLSGNISEPKGQRHCWSLGIPDEYKPSLHGIGGGVVVIWGI